MFLSSLLWTPSIEDAQLCGFFQESHGKFNLRCFRLSRTLRYEIFRNTVTDIVNTRQGHFKKEMHAKLCPHLLPKQI